jgi:hypothetical protein
MGIAFGLTNGFWDIVYDTRIPVDVRHALYAALHPRPGGSAAASLDLAQSGR